jgi:hypothetical protein
MGRLAHRSLLLVCAALLACTAPMSTHLDAKETARRVVEAMLANDPDTFTEFVLPTRRADLQLGTGGDIGPAEMTKLLHCRSVPAEYSDPQMPSPDYDPARSHLVIVAFAEPCLVGFTSFTWEPQDKFVLDLRQVEGHWYLQGVLWPVTRTSPGL